MSINGRMIYGSCMDFLGKYMRKILGICDFLGRLQRFLLMLLARWFPLMSKMARNMGSYAG